MLQNGGSSSGESKSGPIRLCCAEVVEVATDLIAVAGLEEQEQVLDEQVDLDGRFVAEPGQRHAVGR